MILSHFLNIILSIILYHIDCVEWNLNKCHFKVKIISLNMKTVLLELTICHEKLYLILRLTIHLVKVIFR